jgi:hypothetical protein
VYEQSAYEGLLADPVTEKSFTDNERVGISRRRIKLEQLFIDGSRIHDLSAVAVKIHPQRETIVDLEWVHVLCHKEYHRSAQKSSENEL